MKKIEIHCSWDLEFDLYSSKQIELWVDTNPTSAKKEDSIRVGVFIEPPEIRKSVGVNVNPSNFDYLLTYDHSILENSDSSFLYEFGGCWVKDYSFGNKEFGVSTLIGGKQLAPGHSLRTNLFKRSSEIQTPKDIWVSKNFPPANPGNHRVLTGTKSNMFYKQFHIVIENVKRKNWFTEKLIDSLYTKTIPNED